MEGEPKSEQAAQREWIVANLRERGVDDPEIAQAFMAWRTAEEAKRAPDRSVEAFAPENFKPAAGLSIETALIYKDAGLIDQAQEELEFALMDAQNFGDSELCARIEGLINSLS